MDDSSQPVALRLVRLGRGDIERVRNWRNSPEVQRHMVFREHITLEQQEKWFCSIDNDRNYYFIIEQDRRPIGLANLKNVVRESGTAEWGIFFGEPRDSVRGIAARAVAFAVADFAFGQLALRELVARILKENARSIRFHLELGYELQPGQVDAGVEFYLLTPPRHERAAAFARKTLGKIAAVILKL